MADIPAQFVESFSPMPPVPGAYRFYSSSEKADAGMIFCCPCGCGDLNQLPFDRWTWNGSREKPSLTPSVLKTDGCRWHGWLADGVWRAC